MGWDEWIGFVGLLGILLAAAIVGYRIGRGLGERAGDRYYRGKW